ncbi:protein Bouncer-like [Myxocyprinus asiaticus]|uniref:protein Bouncer-like n=1 Tax=Myxocyprinus asiaticus TaxID=70543 RepID=UPI0022239438|nr:protein Bouncer-like [Myxocyprinus asiaticus]
MFLLLTVVLSTDGLLCNYGPLQARDHPFPNITTECSPNKRCSFSRGFYGRVHMLSGQGCVAQHLCGSHQTLMYMGVSYNVTYTCCCCDRCNTPPTVDNLIKKLLGVAISPADNITTASPLDCCPDE